MSNKDWECIEGNIGKEFRTLGFLSATKVKDQAIKLAPDDSTKKVFITIIVPNAPDKGDQVFAELEEFSEHPEKQQVLFNLRSRFTILHTRVEEIEGQQCHHMVLLYNTQALQNYCTVKNPKVKVPIKEDPTCEECQTKVDLEGTKFEFLLVNLADKESYVCVDCINKSTEQKRPPHFCLSSKIYQKNKKSGKKVVHQRFGDRL